MSGVTAQYGVSSSLASSRPRPPVVILCGGRGTRLQEHARAIPKPLVEIGGRPILWHVLHIYLAQGFRDFVLLTGYRGEQIESFVAASSWPVDAAVRCLATGIDTPTGGRLWQAAAELPGGFCATYADGLADVDLDRLLAFHRGHGAAATLTVVRPRLQFGVAQIDPDDAVIGFVEKPRSEHWVNGGFFCFEPAALELLEPDSVLEREPLEQLARAGQLRAFRHAGFWDCLDTYKDAVALNDMWASGRAPWARWDDSANPGDSRRRSSRGDCPHKGQSPSDHDPALHEGMDRAEVLDRPGLGELDGEVIARAEQA